MTQKIMILICVLMGICSVSLAQDEVQTPYEMDVELILEAGRSNITDLDLNSLQLTELPPEIGNLNNLHTLDLSNNQLSNLPPEIGNLINLHTLRLSYNQLINLPPEIGNLTTLHTLDLRWNQLGSLPPEIGKLHNLRTLILYDNRLSSLPSEIGNLYNLYRLDLRVNQLNSLPPEIGNLHNLCQLDFISNQLQYLPIELGYLNRLVLFEGNCYLRRGNNPLISPPAEVSAEGTPAVLDYLRNQTGWHIQRLIIMGIASLMVLVLGIRWQMGRTYYKAKRKRSTT